MNLVLECGAFCKITGTYVSLSGSIAFIFFVLLPQHRLDSDTSHQSLTIPTWTIEKKSLLVLPSVTGVERVHLNVLLSDPVTHTLVCHTLHISGTATPFTLLSESFQFPSPTAAYLSSRLDLTISCCS